MARTLPSLIGVLVAASFSTTNASETEMRDALDEGATRLTADQIVERLADRTVTFENANTGARWLVYYDTRNGTILRPEDSDERMEGFYATDLSDHICIGVYGDEPMRLRCVNVLLIDGVMHKFELDGSLRGRIVEEVSGNMI